MKRQCNAKKGATERRVYVISMDSAHVCGSKMNIGPVWWDYFSNINESFLIQDGTGLCLVNIKVHIFRTLVCRLSSPVDVVKNDRVPFCLKISYFCSKFLD